MNQPTPHSVASAPPPAASPAETRGARVGALWVAPVAIGGAMGAYAWVRYIVFKGVGVEHAPLFLVNKVLGFTGLALIALALNARRFSSQPALADARSRFWGQLGLALSVGHALASAFLVHPAYFADWFAADGRLVWRAEVSLLLGIGGFVALAWLARRPPTLRALAAGVLTLVGLHAFFLGYTGWLQPASWPGYLPPITLWSAAVALLGLWALPNRGD